MLDRYPRHPVLSVSRPWSTWIADGRKPIENRVWQTSYRGPLWIHAAKSWDDSAFSYATPLLGSRPSTRRSDHPIGIIALADLTGICNSVDRIGGEACRCGPWAMDGQHHWRLANVRRLIEPVPTPGRPTLWRPDTDLQAILAAAKLTVTAQEPQS